MARHVTTVFALATLALSCRRDRTLAVGTDPTPQLVDAPVGDGVPAKAAGPVTFKSSNGLVQTLPHAFASLGQLTGAPTSINILLSESPVAHDDQCVVKHGGGRLLYFSLPARGPKEWIEGRWVSVREDAVVRMAEFGPRLDGEIALHGEGPFEWGGHGAAPVWKGGGRFQVTVCLPKGGSFPKPDAPPTMDGALTAMVDGVAAPVGTVLAVPMRDHTDFGKTAEVRLVFHRGKLGCSDLEMKFDEGFDLSSPRSSSDPFDRSGPQPLGSDKYRRLYGHDLSNVFGWVRLDAAPSPPGSTTSTLHGAVFAYGDPGAGKGRGTSLVGSFTATVCPAAK